MPSNKVNNDTKFPGIPECQEECLYDYIFTKVKFGVIILNYKRKKILFQNQYFESIARGQEKQIISEICSLIKKKEFLSGEQREMLLHINTLDFNRLNVSRSQ